MAIHRFLEIFKFKNRPITKLTTLHSPTIIALLENVALNDSKHAQRQIDSLKTEAVKIGLEINVLFYYIDQENAA